MVRSSSPELNASDQLSQSERNALLDDLAEQRTEARVEQVADEEEAVSQREAHSANNDPAYAELLKPGFEREQPVAFAALVKKTSKAKNVSQKVILDELKVRRARQQKASRIAAQVSTQSQQKTIDGAALLDDLVKLINRHLLLPPGAADAMAFWAVHTHAFDAARNSPRLAFSAPSPDCGKSQGLHVLKRMASSPLIADNMTPAAAFRLVTSSPGTTLLMDEGEKYLHSTEYTNLLNSGHSRESAQYVRCEQNAQGEYIPVVYQTWAPIAFAQIGAIADPTTRSRSIVVRMKRALPHEQRPKPSRTPSAVWSEVQGRIAGWAKENLNDLRRADPNMGDLTNRDADNWRPLFAIADAVGGDWSRRARTAALQLTEHHTSPLEDLLLAISRAFEGPKDGLTSLELCERLSADQEFEDAATFSGFGDNERGAGRKLNMALKELGIKSKPLANGKGSNLRGFRKEQFDDAFQRYLPRGPCQQS